MNTCTIDGCDLVVLARGWCRGHYARWFRTGDPGPAAFRAYGRKRCTVRGCRNRHKVVGLCDAHYFRRARHGDVLAHLPVRPYTDRQNVKRWPAVALLDEVGTHSELARLLGRQRMAASKWDRVLLTTAQADEAALALGLHPLSIWPEWLDWPIAPQARCATVDAA